MISQRDHVSCSRCKRAKLDAYWKRYCSSANSEDSDAQKSEVESNILIQFRSPASFACVHTTFLDGTCPLGKLREGISSSRRRGQFAIEGE
jgi:hypothetical protein